MNEDKKAELYQEALNFLIVRKQFIKIKPIETALGLPVMSLFRAVNKSDLLSPKYHAAVTKFVFKTFLNGKIDLPADKYNPALLAVHSKCDSVPEEEFQDNFSEITIAHGKIQTAIKKNSPKEVRAQLIDIGARCVSLVTEIDNEKRDQSPAEPPPNNNKA